MAEVGLKELLEAGVHFGHQTRRWNPKMRRFIHGERGGIYLIDLLKTAALLEQAQNFATEVAHRGGTVLFVGTKKQARDGIKEIAESAGMPYVNHRWLGGLLTNYQTMSARIRRLHDLERYATEGQLALLPTRERLSAEADLQKLRANLGGVKDMQRVPDAMFVIDLKTEAIAVREAQRLRIPIIGLVDTNCDPDGIDYVIPGNDDAIRACNLITHAIGDVVQQGRQRFRTEEEQARREAEEQARREQEERARREQQEREAAEAAERAAAEAALSQAGEGEPRDVAEAEVAQAVSEGAGREVEGTHEAEAAAAIQAAAEPAAPAAGRAGPSRREAIEHPNEGERELQAADAGAGTPAAKESGGERARQRARKAKATKATPAPEPGPSAVAEAAEAAAPADPRRAEGSSGDEASGRGRAELEIVEPATPAEPEAPAAEAPAAANEPAAEAAAAPAAEEAPAAPTEPDASPAATDESGGGVVETAVDTAQTVAETAAGAAETAAEAVAERAPGPVKAAAKAAAGASRAAKKAVSSDDEKKDEDK
jgi:small subunit ribosomal protein S2